MLLEQHNAYANLSQFYDKLKSEKSLRTTRTFTKTKIDHDSSFSPLSTLHLLEPISTIRTATNSSTQDVVRLLVVGMARTSARQTASCIIYLGSRGSTVAAESSGVARDGAHLYVRGCAHGSQLIFSHQPAVERHMPPLTAAGLRHSAPDNAHCNKHKSRLMP